jgi:ribA/ribD-fused uncharacterized protein
MSKYHFFWNGIFCQWYASSFYDPKSDLVFSCAEQYMMYKKAILFNDHESATLIMQTNKPNIHKTLGRKVSGFDKLTWDQNARSIVYRGNFLKFTQNPTLLRELLYLDGTTFQNKIEFVEASRSDAIWGIGMGLDEDGIEDPKNWKGTNWLGECITQVRDGILETLSKKIS